jgi:hypothetical protein
MQRYASSEAPLTHPQVVSPERMIKPINRGLQCALCSNKDHTLPLQYSKYQAK